ncbi:hypothetical protein [Streptomyces europaeiscabiei]|uniref:hypothetical protein n=1 Tax=Streptomyces europaeiscabiei TaxID=146819 RepID=UPI0029B12064|nr:hypothetical protein [Streptomyces europaeiscabiei]MDX2757277.1 hypothetical protein [Streptomyces europaeiscabiei]
MTVDSVAPVVGLLRPIGLDELVDRAELLTRVDRNYMLPTADLPPVIGGLDGGGTSLSGPKRHLVPTARTVHVGLSAVVSAQIGSVGAPAPADLPAVLFWLAHAQWQ